MLFYLKGAVVTAYDPVATETAKTIFKNTINYSKSSKSCLKGADAAIVVTEWPEFKTITPQNYLQLLKQPILIDGRRIYNPEMYSASLKFVAIGLGQ